MPSTEAERIWIDKATTGDQAAFGQLVEAYNRPVYNLAYRMLGNGPEAEDATQETFLKAYRKFNTYDTNRKLSTWLLAIASNGCIDRLRRRRYTWLSLEEMAEHGRSPTPQQGGSPESLTVARESQEEMQSLLLTLKPKDRAVILLRYWYELSYEEIAETMECTVSSVKSRLHRARKTMAEAVLTSQTTGAQDRSAPREVVIGDHNSTREVQRV